MKKDSNDLEKNKNRKEFKLKQNLMKIIKSLLFWFFVLLLFWYFYPDRFSNAASLSLRYAKEMIIIFPAVLVIMGLADIWIPTSLVKEYLGHNSGIKGKFLAVFLGTLPTGPMYIAFPIAAELIRKKASLSNVIIFLGVWASLKIPQLGIEVQFIGLKFSFLRFVFTLTAIIMIGIIMEKFINIEELDI